MTTLWTPIAQRIVAGLGVQPGELIQVRDHIDRPDVIYEVLLAVDRAGATPLLDHQSPAYLNRWLAEATPDAIVQSSRHRLHWLEQVDRVITLSGGIPDFALATPAALAAWEELDASLTQIEETRRLPIMVVAAPNAQRAAKLGMTLTNLEAHVLPALQMDIDASRAIIAQAQRAVAGEHIVIGTGAGCKLHLARGERIWHGDDGVIDDEDRRRQTIVSNLPAGSIYTTVLETQTYGSLYLPSAPEASEVVLHFEAGRIVDIEAAHGADALARWLDSHTGEPRRISHIGVGLNPHLRTPIGWTLVDEHIAGALFLALGENRYMGGENASSLNHDFALFGASLWVDARLVVEQGVLQIAGGRT
ncbi:MAG TPA: aminopeptidase [Chloroflexi bacterium]|nr:aminopeptidase [Chloroflexota bacterium]